MILAGTARSNPWASKTFGFGGGRADIWELEDDVYWGAERSGWRPATKPESRYSGDRVLANPLAACRWA